LGSATAVIVGAGPAGLAAALALKKSRPDADVVVLDKASGPGQHNLSGAVIEPGPLEAFLDWAHPAWRDDGQGKKVLARRVAREDTYLFLGPERTVRLTPLLRAARGLGLGPGHLLHQGDYIVSAAQLVAWLTELARQAGVEVLHGFSVEEVALDDRGRAIGVRTVAQGLDRQRRPLRHHQPGELLRAEVVMLAEGCRGFVTERWLERAGLKRAQAQLFSVGVKQVIEVSPERYQAFGEDRVVHSVGFPLWTPVVGPGMTGGGFVYPMGESRLAVGLIMGLDWVYRDLVPQDAYVRLTEHAFIRALIDGGKVVEGGARMIPEGGWYAIPRDPATQAIGQGNVVLLGDAAGLVDMQRIKGQHNAIASGLAAGLAAAERLDQPDAIAADYTRRLGESGVLAQMRAARNFRQVLARFGNLVGLPLTPVATLLPQLRVEADYRTMTQASYPLRLDRPFDKDAFVASAHVEHREDQPVHCEVLDEAICRQRCAGTFDHPCVGFCLGGVYEMHHGEMRPTNPSNCVHCKTCECKCPYDNLRWHVPEGSGGPRYDIC
jgi:electron-transferring-flavoprotein dehydrogenase